MNSLLKVQILITSLTTIGVWSNLFINFKNNYPRKS